MRTQLFIDGQWRDGGGQAIAVIDPATEETLCAILAATARDVDDAVGAARSAFGAWSRRCGAERAGYLLAIADRIDESLDALAEREVRDNGKPLPEAQWDVGDAAGCFRFYANLAEELDRQQSAPIALPDPRFHCTVRREPIGVAGQIIPWNYPLLMAAWKVAPALAAGATMVLKPSELTPLTALDLASIAEEVDLPRGVLNVVPGYGHDAGKALASHPDVDKIAFTGSVPTGSAIMAAAAQDIKNISLELGGKSAVIVFADADIDAVVEWVMFGIFWNQGQVCSATSRLLVDDRIADALLDRLIAEARKIPIGNGLDPGTLLGPLVSRAQQDKVLGFIDRARASGHAPVAGGGRPSHLPKGYFVEPTIFDNVSTEHELWREEVFGPVLAIRRFRTEDEAIRLANDTRFGLAGAVMSSDPERCERVANALRAGIVWINCSQPTFSEAPWGGMKQSGIGRELGAWGLGNYLETKQVTRYVSDEPWSWYLKR